MLKKLVMTVAGVAVMLAYWSIKARFSSGDDPSVKSGSIPAKVLGGGGGLIDIEAEASGEGVVSVIFESNNDGVGDNQHKFVETWEKISPGVHNYTIDVPPNMGGSIEVRMDDPPVGSKVRATFKLHGSTVAEDIQTLPEPLKPGYGFTAHVQVEDYTLGKAAAD